MNKKHFSYVDLLLLLVVAIWGGLYTFAKIALAEFEPTTFAALRSILAALVLAVILGLKEKGGLHLRKKDLIPFALLGFLGQFLNRLSFSYGVSLTSASNASILMATTPVFAALLAVFLKIEHVTIRSGMGIVVAFAGVFLVIKGDWGIIKSRDAMLCGDLFVLGAALSWSFFTIYAKRLLRVHTILKLTTWSSLFGSLFMIPFLLRPFSEGTLTRHSFKAWLCILYVAIMANVVAQLCWVRGISTIGPTKTAIYQNLVPVIAISLAALILAESVLPVQIVGAMLVIGGVYLTRFG